MKNWKMYLVVVAAVFFKILKIKKISKGHRHTTNNRMEIMAVIKALEAIETLTNRPITIFSDSQYTINGITKGWAKTFKKLDLKGFYKS